MEQMARQRVAAQARLSWVTDGEGAVVAEERKKSRRERKMVIGMVVLAWVKLYFHTTNQTIKLS